jgi:cytochrome P450
LAAAELCQSIGLALPELRFAIHYPLKVLMRILGVPQSDEKRMLKLTQELFASEDADLGHGEGVKGDPALPACGGLRRGARFLRKRRIRQRRAKLHSARRVDRKSSFHISTSANGIR